MRGNGIRQGTTINSDAVDEAGLLLRYRRRLIRKRLLWRAFRKRHDLTLISDNRSAIESDDVLSFTTLRNEEMRLPFFLDHHRRLGVGHFLIVDNGSDDGSVGYLQGQKDVTLWRTDAGYRGSRFGVDWLNWLQRTHAAGRWSLVVDADEALIYPDWERRGLPELTRWMDRSGQRMMGALMLDMYPKGPVDAHPYKSGQDPVEVLNWFDASGYWCERQPKYDNLWLQGGPRARVFFADDPARAPTMNKIPLIKWQRGYTYLNSTHSALPTWLNRTGGNSEVSGALLHSKFLAGTADRARYEKARDEHFHNGALYGDYYDALSQNPDLWCPQSVQFEGWAQLVEHGLMAPGRWLDQAQ